jgi:hypothetical protein
VSVLQAVSIEKQMSVLVQGLLGSNLSVRSTVRMGSSLSVVGAVCMGSGLCVTSFLYRETRVSVYAKIHNELRLSFVGVFVLGSSVSLRQLLIRFFAFVHSSSLSVLSFIQRGSTLAAHQFARAWMRLGSSLSVLSKASLGSSLNFVHFWSMCSLRGSARVSSGMRVVSGVQLCSFLSIFDAGFMGSSSVALLS